MYFYLMLGRVMLICDSFALVGWTPTPKDRFARHMRRQKAYKMANRPSRHKLSTSMVEQGDEASKFDCLVNNAPDVRGHKLWIQRKRSTQNSLYAMEANLKTELDKCGNQRQTNCIRSALRSRTLDQRLVDNEVGIRQIHLQLVIMCVHSQTITPQVIVQGPETVYSVRSTASDGAIIPSLASSSGGAIQRPLQ